MKELVILPVHQVGFSLAMDPGSPPCLRVTGNADMEMLPFLAPYLASVHRRVCEERSAMISVDCRELYFMNSSCIKVLLAWISQVSQLPSAERYVIRFLCNPNLPWQRRTVDAMQAFAPRVVESEFR